MMSNYNYCPYCNTKLIVNENNVKYCPKCDKEYYANFNSAVSMIVRYHDEVLLIKQYHEDRYILVAGYIEKGESAEEAAIRELKEETNLEALSVKVLKTKYFAKTNTLMINCLVDIKDKNITINEEVDSYTWFSFDDALANICPNSTAKEFYINFYNNYR